MKIRQEAISKFTTEKIFYKYLNKISNKEKRLYALQYNYGHLFYTFLNKNKNKIFIYSANEIKNKEKEKQILHVLEDISYSILSPLVVKSKKHKLTNEDFILMRDLLNKGLFFILDFNKKFDIKRYNSLG